MGSIASMAHRDRAWRGTAQGEGRASVKESKKEVMRLLTRW